MPRKTLVAFGYRATHLSGAETARHKNNIKTRGKTGQNLLPKTLDKILTKMYNKVKFGTLTSQAKRTTPEAKSRPNQGHHGAQGQTKRGGGQRRGAEGHRWTAKGGEAKRTGAEQSRERQRDPTPHKRTRHTPQAHAKPTQEKANRSEGRKNRRRRRANPTRESRAQRPPKRKRQRGKPKPTTRAEAGAKGSGSQGNNTKKKTQDRRADQRSPDHKSARRFSDVLAGARSTRGRALLFRRRFTMEATIRQIEERISEWQGLTHPIDEDTVQALITTFAQDSELQDDFNHEVRTERLRMQRERHFADLSGN